jgi:hypothetical protein
VEERAKSVMQILKIDNFLSTLPFLNLSVQRLFQIGTIWRRDDLELTSTNMDSVRVPNNRMEFLAMHLKCEQFEVADMMIKAPVLLSASFSKTRNILKVLLGK